MKTVALLAQKGGSGKSTIAVHLAVTASMEGMNVCLIDTDPQRSLAYWQNARNSPIPAVISIMSSQIGEVLEIAKNDNIDICIIDTPPHSSPATAQVAEVADYIVVPCQPSLFDICALENTLNIIEAKSKKSTIVISRAPSRNRDVQDTIEAIKRLKVSISPVVISDRTSYRRALVQGQAVGEFDPHGKAAKEINDLWTWLKQEAL